MTIRFDTTEDNFVVDSDECGSCGGDLYDTSCDAPGCGGKFCPSCGSGCDVEFAEGQCRAAIDSESDEDRLSRINAERAAFGLSPVTEEP